MHPSVDHVEAGHRQHRAGIAGQVGNVLVQGQALGRGTSLTTQQARHAQAEVACQFAVSGSADLDQGHVSTAAVLCCTATACRMFSTAAGSAVGRLRREHML